MRAPEFLVSSRAAVRRARAIEWLRTQGASSRLLVVGPTREAAIDLVREAGRGRAAGFGWQRLSFMELASTLAATELARRQLVPIGQLSLEALCSRLLHDESERARQANESIVFDAQLPGTARALAKTLTELRMALVAGERVAAVRPELARLLAALEGALARGGFADRSDVLRVAAERARASEFAGHPLLVLDLPVGSAREESLLAALATDADLFACAPAGDERAIERLARALRVEPRGEQPPESSALARLQRRLFSRVQTDGAEDAVGADARSAATGAVEIFSAPGEGRECVEIARRVLAAASRGVPFDRMAVLLRQPELYRPLLEEALARAQIPAWFAQGTQRPDPAGRAFLTLLACAADGLSARRFAEYVSLGELPSPTTPARSSDWMPTGESGELLASAIERAAQSASSAGEQLEAQPHPSSWRWESLLNDAAVIGGREVENAEERWSRRLASHRAELVRREESLRLEDEAGAESARRAREDLDALVTFASPLLARLAALPREANWGVWLPLLDDLAAHALRNGERVRAHLAQLVPLAPVGPVSLAEVELLLARELAERSAFPPANREGRLFVAPIDAARGLAFAEVFVPGLAERLFPPKALQDPLLRDRDRVRIDPQLVLDAERVADERLQLRLAAGAAGDRLVLSWPRLELQTGRTRVPSFYGLEALAAAEGRLPGFAELSQRAELAADSHGSWPAPRDPACAIDAAEHDLALLADSLHRPEEETRGLGRYLLAANPALRRALYRRAGRARRRWFSSDGLVDASPAARLALAPHQLDARSYSASALQNYAACPLRFLLSAVHRLEPREEPRAIDEIDPLSRGSLMHEVQFALFTALQAEQALPLFDADPARCNEKLAHALSRLAPIADEIAARFRDELVPAIARVWDDCVASIKSDLREWLRRVSLEPGWVPVEFERSFGLADRGARDAHSQTLAVHLAGGLQLRGSIDLVERRADGKLRAVDYKSGKQRAQPGLVIGGGAQLQPVLYALALEQLFPDARVDAGTLFYCTHAGEYAEVSVPLDEVARAAQKLLARTVGEALRDGFFPAAPRAGECARCDYLEICGAGEEARIAKKPQERLLPLHTLRGSP